MGRSTDNEPVPAVGINGSVASVGIDRAVGELRRGRALCITAGDAGGERQGLILASVESVRTPLLRRLASTGRALTLFLTAERARAAELALQAQGPVAVRVPAGVSSDVLLALSCASPLRPPSGAVLSIDADPQRRALADAAFQLAKAGRLLPALIGIDSHGIDDPSVLCLGMDDVQRYVRYASHSLKRMSQARVPLDGALDCELAVFRDEHGLGEHVAVLIGSIDALEVVPVRLHSACLTGDLLGSLRCDCGEQLRTAVERIASLGGGVLLYLDQEGRGIGLANKLRAYALQDAGLDTIDADQHLGFSSDERNYDVAAALLHELGIGRIRLLTNNPHKIAALSAHGIDVVGRLPLIGSTNTHNERYLKAKRERAGHLADEPQAGCSDAT